VLVDVVGLGSFALITLLVWLFRRLRKDLSKWEDESKRAGELKRFAEEATRQQSIALRLPSVRPIELSNLWTSLDGPYLLVFYHNHSPGASVAAQTPAFRGPSEFANAGDCSADFAWLKRRAQSDLQFRFGTRDRG